MSTVVHDVLQPGHPGEVFQCVVKRERTSTKCTYTLSIGVGSPPEKEGKFLLAARRVSSFLCKEYVIYSDDATEVGMSKGSVVHVVGKLRSNTMLRSIINPEFKSFTIYESQLPHHNGVVSSKHGPTSSTEVLPGVKAGYFKVGQVDFDHYPEHEFDSPIPDPPSMRCTLHTISASTIDAKGFPRATPKEVVALRLRSNINDSFHSSRSLCCLQPKPAVSDSSAADFEPLVLKNRVPRWKEKQLGLNFAGPIGVPAISNSQPAVTSFPAVNNFQLVATTEPNQLRLRTNDKVLLQFLKLGKDTFKMDYCYPFSAFHAFSICVSSFR